MEDTIQRVEYTRIGFGMIGKMLDTLAKDPNDALIVLALMKGSKMVSEIADITGLERITIHFNLHRLTYTKIVRSYNLDIRMYFELTETGKILANAWIAFMKNATTATILPKEDRDRIQEFIKTMEK